MIDIGLPPIAVAKSEELQPEAKRYNSESANVLVNSLPIKQTNDTLKNEQPDSEEKETNNAVNYNDLAEKLKSLINQENIAIKFSYDEESNRMIMKIIDKETEEVIKQFPPEITLKIARIVADTLENGQVANAKV